MVDEKSRKIEERLKAYYRELDKRYEIVEKSHQQKDAKKLLEYIDESGLDSYFDDRHGQNIIDEGKRKIQKDENAVVDVGMLLSIVGFLLSVIGIIKTHLDKYKYIPRWKPTDGIPDYNYHISDGNDLYIVFNKYLRKKYKRRKVVSGERLNELGFIFGNVRKDNRIELKAIAPYYGSVEDIVMFLLDLLESAKYVTPDEFKKEFIVGGVKLYSDDFWEDFRKSGDKIEFIKRHFLGMYVFEEDLLKHDIVTRKKLGMAVKRLGLTMKKLGITQFRKFLFLEKSQYKLIKSVFKEFEKVFEKLNHDKPRPPIVICLDNKEEHNCMCIGHHKDLGLQRIRHMDLPIEKKEFPHLVYMPKGDIAAPA